MTTKKQYICAAILSGVALTTSTAYAETKTYEFTGFTEADVSAGIVTNITVGGDYSVRAEAEPKGLETLKIEQRGDALKIGRTKKIWDLGRAPKVTVTITMPRLEGIDASSGSSVNASGIKASDFNADVSSGASVELSGSCETIVVDVSSGASTDAQDLKCDNAIVDASSGAATHVYASMSATVDASSGAATTVHGNPQNTNIDKSSGAAVSITD